MVHLERKIRHGTAVVRIRNAKDSKFVCSRSGNKLKHSEAANFAIGTLLPTNYLLHPSSSPVEGRNSATIGGIIYATNPLQRPLQLNLSRRGASPLPPPLFRDDCSVIMAHDRRPRDTNPKLTLTRQSTEYIIR